MLFCAAFHKAATVDAKVSESEREIVAWWRALHAEVLAGHAVLDVAVCQQSEDQPPTPHEPPAKKRKIERGAGSDADSAPHNGSGAAHQLGQPGAPAASSAPAPAGTAASFPAENPSATPLAPEPPCTPTAPGSVPKEGDAGKEEESSSQGPTQPVQPAAAPSPEVASTPTNIRSRKEPPASNPAGSSNVSHSESTNVYIRKQCPGHKEKHLIRVHPNEQPSNEWHPVPYDRLDGAKVQCGTCKQIITLSLSTELPPHKLAPSAVPDLDKP
uniref:Uncharacterized protein n=1 Tax=Haptolina ericina TaxID=156174 RepID=A0A7S3B4P3_9EUKA